MGAWSERALDVPAELARGGVRRVLEVAGIAAPWPEWGGRYERDLPAAWRDCQDGVLLLSVAALAGVDGRVLVRCLADMLSARRLAGVWGSEDAAVALGRVEEVVQVSGAWRSSREVRASIESVASRLAGSLAALERARAAAGPAGFRVVQIDARSPDDYASIACLEVLQAAWKCRGRLQGFYPHLVSAAFSIVQCDSAGMAEVGIDVSQAAAISCAAFAVSVRRHVPVEALLAPPSRAPQGLH